MPVKSGSVRVCASVGVHQTLQTRQTKYEFIIIHICSAKISFFCFLPLFHFSVLIKRFHCNRPTHWNDLMRFTNQISGRCSFLRSKTKLTVELEIKHNECDIYCVVNKHKKATEKKKEEKINKDENKIHFFWVESLRWNHLEIWVKVYLVEEEITCFCVCCCMHLVYTRRTTSLALTEYWCRSTDTEIHFVR